MDDLGRTIIEEKDGCDIIEKDNWRVEKGDELGLER